MSRSDNALEKQTQSIERRNFEVKFLQSLNAHIKILGSIVICETIDGSKRIGRDALSYLYHELNEQLDKSHEALVDPRAFGEAG